MIILDVDETIVSSTSWPMRFNKTCFYCLTGNFGSEGSALYTTIQPKCCTST